MGLADKQHLAHAYGGRIGKASVTGYCIKFKRLSDVDAGVLEGRCGMELGAFGKLYCIHNMQVHSPQLEISLQRQSRSTIRQ